MEIQKYKPAGKHRGHPEEQVLLLADHHDGEITDTYDPEICRQRTERILTSTLTITELHRHIYDVDHLKIFILDDKFLPDRKEIEPVAPLEK